MQPERLDALLEVLAVAQVSGDLGPGDPARHVEHSLGLADLLEGQLGSQPATVLDLGSGAGIPGLVLAEVWPRSTVTLLEGRTARCERARHRIATLGFEARVAVAEGRAEELARDPGLRESFDLVVARAFGPPGVTAELGAPFVRPGGWLAVSEPRDADPAARWPEQGRSALGLGAPTVRRAGGASVAVMRREGPIAATWPRAAAAKRPLWRV